MKLEIEDLIASKAFDELTNDERAWVLSQMTELDYESQRAIIVDSQNLWMEEEQELDPLPPSPAIFAALQQKQAAIPVEQQVEPKKKGFLAAVLGHRIATWQAVAASLIFMLMWQFGTSTATTTTEGDAYAHNEPVDTVYKYITQIKEVLQPADTVIEVIYKNCPTANDEPIDAVLFADAADSLDMEGAVARQQASFDDILQYCTTSSGQPASQDTFFQLLGSKLQL